jgi:hypothetical protein
MITRRSTTTSAIAPTIHPHGVELAVVLAGVAESPALLAVVGGGVAGGASVAGGEVDGGRVVGGRVVGGRVVSGAVGGEVPDVVEEPEPIVVLGRSEPPPPPQPPATAPKTTSVVPAAIDLQKFFESERIRVIRSPT